jgi:hypothetical protein
MSEQVIEEGTEEADEVDDEQEETDEGDEQEEKPADDTAKLKRALERARKDAKKARADLAEARKQAKTADPNAGENEELRKQVEELQQARATADAVSELFDAGFNGTKAQALKMTKLMDLDELEDAIEDLKEDFPERFGKQKAPAGSRPHTGSGRDRDGDNPKKDETDEHSKKLLRMYRGR